MEELNAHIELKESRNGKTVPVVDGIYLHSIYNPEKEAQAFACNYEQSIKEKSRVLVLGLGFGYHVEEIAKLAEKIHGDYKIFVYEPNKAIIEAFSAAGGFNNPNIEIIHAQNPVEVFDRKEFILFLASKPAIIRHEASFNLNKKFFREFLTFKAPVAMESYQRLLTEEARRFFPTKEGSVEQALESIKATGRLASEKDYAFFLLEAVVNSSKRITQKQK